MYNHADVNNETYTSPRLQCIYMYMYKYIHVYVHDCTCKSYIIQHIQVHIPANHIHTRIHVHEVQVELT